MYIIDKFDRPMFSRSEVIVQTNTLTNRRRRKHTPRSAMLRRWVKITFSLHRLSGSTTSEFQKVSLSKIVNMTVTETCLALLPIATQGSNHCEMFSSNMLL